MTHVIAVVMGLSGVGKSWLLQRVSDRVQMQVLSAGNLIAEQIAGDRKDQVVYDELRARDVKSNQRALKAGFEKRLDSEAQVVVLDAHVMIDTPEGLEIIPSDVFRGIGASLIVFLEDDPSRILHHRSQDVSRKRPRRDLDTLRIQQEVAREAAQAVASNLGVRCHILRAGDVDSLVRVLQAQKGP